MNPVKISLSRGLLFAALALSCTLATAQNKKVVLSQLFQSIQLLPVYVALDGGFFEKQGLDVSKQTAGSANGALSALLSGSADFSLHGPEWSAIAAEKGAPVQVVASVVSRPSFWIATSPDVKFNTIADLRGQTVVTGLMPTTSTSVFFKLLKENGLTPGKDLTVTQVAIGSEPGPLMAGQAKVAVLYQPGLDQVAAKGMKVVYSFSKLYSAYTVAAISTRKNIDPELARRFVQGLQNAMIYMQKDEAGTIAIAKKEFPTLDPVVVEAAVKRMLSEQVYSTSVDITQPAFKAAMQTQIDLGNLKTMPVYETLITRDYIKAAVASK
ncbi:NMT1/THI5 like protein [compost metagenome]